jgi:hypothetical protein
MTVSREHAIASGRIWGTISDCFSQVDGPCILVPISQIDGMSDTEMASTIKGLVDEARITGLFEWLDKWEYQYHTPMRDNENPKKLFINLCIALGRQDEHTERLICLLEENLRDMEILQHKNAEIREAYAEVCGLLDGAHKYLLSKPSKLTPGQQRARSAILKIRNGCAVCGLLEGQHTEKCLTLRRSVVAAS